MKGQNSGSGSYNELAQFKADIINNFIEKNQIKSIADYGVGDGNQLKLINTEKLIYTGIDVSEFIISKCKEEFKDDKTKKFILVDNIDNELKADLVLSCDVIYHLIEDDIYKEYMDNLFTFSKKYVIIYANNKDANHAIHVKFRIFTTYIENNLPEWQLIKHIPNKYPQLKLGQKNDKTSPSDFYIYKKDDMFLSITNDWKNYIKTQLIPIVKSLNVKLEGNIYSSHHSFNDTSNSLSNKRFNIYNVLKKTQPKTILEIGFNAGFSCLLMKIILPDTNITCVDLNEHKYVMPCFNKLSSDFNNLTIIPGSSYEVGLPQLIKENKQFDFIHIDGDHRLEGAIKDMELCLKLCHDNTIILFDDTNIKYLDDLCASYVNKGKLKDYHFDMYLNNQKYKHRFLQVDKIELLLTGCGSSGTKYISELLKKNGIDVGHDFNPIGKRGFVTNAIVNKEVWVYDKAKYPLEVVKEKILLSNFSNIIHIVRHPLLVISSIIKKWENNNNIWLHIQNGALSSEKDKNISILNAMKYWLYHNKHIMKYTKKIVKFEDVLQNSDTLEKYLNKSIVKTLNKKINSSNTNIKLDWNSLFNVDKHITNEIIKLCDIYGYEIPMPEVPVYISLTSIFKNQDILLQTLQSIMNQTRLPDKIFLYLSEESYLLDTGFKDKNITNSNLLKFIDDNSIIDINWVKNTGPYRKLLPLLKEKWEEDCIIITIDDDTIYDTKLIENLINDYNEQKCVIGYRGITPLFDKLENFDYLKTDKLQHLSLYNFLTGKGGILYKPEFFYKTKDLIFNDKIYLDKCHTTDDIWFYIVRLLNNVKGYVGDKKWMIKDNSRKGLYYNFNSHNNNNTLLFKNTINKLKELGYKTK